MPLLGVRAMNPAGRVVWGGLEDVRLLVRHALAVAVATVTQVQSVAAQRRKRCVAGVAHRPRERRVRQRVMAAQRG